MGNVGFHILISRDSFLRGLPTPKNPTRGVEDGVREEIVLLRSSSDLFTNACTSTEQNRTLSLTAEDKENGSS